jgi:hypothetical protein
LSFWVKQRRIALLFIIVSVFSCKTPPVPSEVQRAEAQEQDLWRAGAPLIAPGEYRRYIDSLRLVRQRYQAEKLKLAWFRRYEALQEEYRAVLEEGDSLLGKISEKNEKTRTSLAERHGRLIKRIAALNQITLFINERGRARQCLSQAEVLLKQIDSLAGQKKFDEASSKIGPILELARQAEEAVFSLLSRYRDPGQIGVWKKWADETIAESRKKGSTAIVVYKLERKLIVYKSGEPVRSFDVGLGFNGLSVKLIAGDDATPEGRYKIIKKLPVSQYYKALLINYPNDEDKKRFTLAKRNGGISDRASIGGLVEIHGGGKDSLTRGCVAVDNDLMDEIFDLASVGTPVTIVGTVEADHGIFKTLRDLGE